MQLGSVSGNNDIIPIILYTMFVLSSVFLSLLFWPVNLLCLTILWICKLIVRWSLYVSNMSAQSSLESSLLISSLTDYSVPSPFVCFAPANHCELNALVMSFTPQSCRSTPHRRMLTRCAVLTSPPIFVAGAKLFFPLPHPGSCPFLLSLSCVSKE